ncbi:MAG: tetratricopeptide repeat protein [Candidatus Natronoplasma sp.]
MTLIQMVLTRGRDRILLHLEAEKDFTEIEEHGEVPYSLCQKGIAESIDLSRNRTSEIISDLAEAGLVKEDVYRVVGLKRRRKVYSLTSEGYKRAKNLRSEVEDEKVKVITKSSEAEVKLKNVDSYISSREPLLVALKKMDESKVIDLTESEKEGSDVFAGRIEEMKLLKRKLAEVRDNGSSTLFVRGNAGIGKTRIINEFKERALSEGFKFYSGKGLYEKSESYLPFIVAFEELNKSDEAPSLPLFGNDRGENTSIERGIDEENREMIFHETTEILRSLSEKSPMVIFIDDLQWADKASLMLLHHFSERLTDAPVLFIGAYRPEDVDDQDFLKELLQRMNRENLYDQIELGPLRWEHTKEIIQGHLGRLSVPDEFVELVYETSEGNPLFSEELVKQMREEGVLDPDKNRFPSKTDGVELPKVVSDIIESRIKRLDRKNLKVLRIGSVIGEDIPFSLLNSMTHMDSFELLEYVDILTGLGIWQSEPEEDVFSFGHGLIHDAVYHNIPKQMRKELHSRVAESTQEVFEDKIENHYSDIGYHYKRAEEFSKASEFYRRAGEKAESIYAHENAVEMFEEALELAERSYLQEENWYILEKLGDVHKTIGEYNTSLEYYEKIPKEKADSEHQQRIYRKKASIYEREGDFDKSVETIEEGLSEKYDESIESCRLLYKKGGAEVRQGMYDRAKDDFLNALDIWKSFGGDREYAMIEQGLGNVYLYKGEYEESLEHLEKALETWRSLGDREGESATLNSLGIVNLNKGNLDLSLEYYKKSLDIRKKRGDKRDIHSTLNNIGTIYLKKGDMEKAIEHYQESLDIWEKIGDKQGIVISLINMGEYHLKQGDYESSLEKQERSLEISEEINFKKGKAASLSNMGKIYFLKGNIDRSKENFERSLNVCREIGYRSLLPNPLRGLAEVFLSDRDYERALEMVEEGLEISSEVGLKTEEGICHRIMGKIYSGMGDIDHARKSFEKSKEILEEVGDKKELAELLYHYSLMLKAESEIERGERFLERSRRIFGEMGMDRWVEKCEDEM